MDYKRKSVDEMTDEERSKIKRTNLASRFEEEARNKEEADAKLVDNDVEEANLNTSVKEEDGEEKDDDAGVRHSCTEDNDIIEITSDDTDSTEEANNTSVEEEDGEEKDEEANLNTSVEEEDGEEKNEEANLNTSVKEEDGKEKDEEANLNTTVEEDDSEEKDKEANLNTTVEEDDSEEKDADAGVRHSCTEDNDIIEITSDDTDSTSGDS